MPVVNQLLSGPDLEKVVNQVRDWYVDMRLKAVQAMTDPYPYGSRPITPQEQYHNYSMLQESDWLQMREALHRLYLGHENASTLVDNELMKYQRRMERIGQQLRANQPVTEEII